jgi:hypothetical protein
VSVGTLLSTSQLSKYHHCALVQWFTHVAEEPDDLTGMWVVHLDIKVDGSLAVGVIHLDSVLHVAHLMPVYGDKFLPLGLFTESSLNIFQCFYVNKYIDYHAFEIAA